MLIIKKRTRVNQHLQTSVPFLFFFKIPFFKKIKWFTQSNNYKYVRKFIIPTTFYLSMISNKIYAIISDLNTISTFATGSYLMNFSFFKRRKLNIRSILTYPYISLTLYGNHFNFICLPILLIKSIYEIRDIFSLISLYKGTNGSFLVVKTSNKSLLNCTVQLPSGQFRKINLWSLGIFGRRAGIFQNYIYFGNYQSSYNSYVVRGIAKNPTDHHNGGRSNTKSPFFTRFGRIAKKNK